MCASNTHAGNGIIRLVVIVKTHLSKQAILGNECAYVHVCRELPF